MYTLYISHSEMYKPNKLCKLGYPISIHRLTIWIGSCELIGLVISCWIGKMDQLNTSTIYNKSSAYLKSTNYIFMLLLRFLQLPQKSTHVLKENLAVEMVTVSNRSMFVTEILIAHLEWMKINLTVVCSQCVVCIHLSSFHSKLKYGFLWLSHSCLEPLEMVLKDWIFDFSIAWRLSKCLFWKTTLHLQCESYYLWTNQS